MRNLVEFLARYQHWFLFVILEFICAVLIVRHNHYQGSVWFSSANVVAGKFYEVDAELQSYLHLSELNSQLAQRNVQLEQRVRELSEQLQSVTDTSNRVLPPLQNLRLIPAKVIDNSIAKTDNFITIDKGSADGVETDMGVACGTGVVGIVYLVSAHHSVVIPVLNSKSNISCAIDGRGYFGYLRWEGGRSDIAYIDDIPRHATFKKGDQVVTSGYSSVFPAGILVGKILNTFNSGNGFSYRLQIKLSTDFARLRDVCVINDKEALKRLSLIQAAQDSIKPKEAK